MLKNEVIYKKEPFTDEEIEKMREACKNIRDLAIIERIRCIEAVKLVLLNCLPYDIIVVIKNKEPYLELFSIT